MSDSPDTNTNNFIRNIINDDIKRNKNGVKVLTRFPPEPNGYLHIGHAKSMCLNFGLAADYDGFCNLRFDDTNPEKEEAEYTEAIERDIKWLGFTWDERRFFASDYFEKLYEFARCLIQKGKAYVDHLSADEIREYRGTLTEPGKPSPYRDRSVDENLELFARMRNGEFAEGECLLRAKIDMASPNVNMRDPAIYRIKKREHHRTGNKWCIYPLYDYTHCLSDALEGVTYSLCTLEFEDHRPLYDWFLEQLNVPCRPRQIEFARLNLAYTVTSKRKLKELVEDEIVSGWDDPRMPTIIGMRRRGYPPAAIRDFCERIGVTKSDSLVEFSVLENCVRANLEKHARRMLAVLNPLKIVVENYPENHTEKLEAPWHPQKPEMGSRLLPFSRELYIERDDFMEYPSGKFFRLGPGREVRLRYAYCITCHEVIKNDNGDIVELRCCYDPATRGGKTPDGRKVRGTIHWVSAAHALTAKVRLYDKLFLDPRPDSNQHETDWKTFLNPNSSRIIEKASLEPSLIGAEPEMVFQFERLGYFYVDSKDSRKGKPVFNRIVTLRDSWAKQKGK